MCKGVALSLGHVHGVYSGLGALKPLTGALSPNNPASGIEMSSSQYFGQSSGHIVEDLFTGRQFPRLSVLGDIKDVLLAKAET